MIEYEDFSLKIEPKRGEVYPIIVLRSPAGEGRSSFTLPFDPNEIGEILFDLGRTVRGEGGVSRRDVSPAATSTRLQQIGDQLFRSLFSGPTRSLLDRSLGMIHGQQRGLRIKIHIDPEDHSLAQLASLPWEFLYRKETRDFLNLSRFTPILRYLDVQRPDTPLPLEPPLRILVVISSPSDYLWLDLDRERLLIESSWAKQNEVQVEFMERATILALQDRLADQPYHVLHYMGHGGIDERTGRGVLVMEDEEGKGRIVDGNTLGILLRDLPTMRLAFLNACDTAKVTKEKGLDPFAGVASAMVMAGIPAVVAMQFPVSDRAAITFSQKFYPLLARGEPVDAAVAEGRRAICLAESGSMEWGTPVLFLRAPDGVIFQVDEAQYAEVPQSKMPEVQEVVDEELEADLAELYTRGLSFFWLEEWEKAARSFQAIVEVRPDYEEAADKLAAAKLQSHLHTLYTQAEEAQKKKDWADALVALEQLETEAADYKDVGEMLEEVRKEKQLADLYDQAQRLHQAEQWPAVVKVFGQIHTIKPDYPDPEGLLPVAEREAAEQKRQAELNQLYSQAVREMDTRDWSGAQQLLTQVQEMEPGFRQTEQLLAKVEKEIEQGEAARQRQMQIATYYEQALGLAQAKQWQQVLAKMDEIQALDPEFVDPDELASRAQEEVTKEEQEARRQSELAALYAESVRLLKAGQYQEALEKWGQVQELDSRYPDRQKIHATASRELESLARGLPAGRKLPRWIFLSIGGVVLLSGILAIIFGGSIISRIILGGDEGIPAAIRDETPVTPTATITPTISPTPTETTVVSYINNRFQESAHAAASDEAWRRWDETEHRVVPDNCSKCHSADGLPTFLTTGGTAMPKPVSNGLTCETCHEHTNPFTLYPSEEVEFPSGAMVTFEDPKANLCLNCHQGRNSTSHVNEIISSAGVENDVFSDDLVFQNPHYFAAGATLFGTEVQGAYEYDGKSYNGRLIHVPDHMTCIDCHDTHALNIKVDQCSHCHSISSEEGLRDIRKTEVDFDGDGDTSNGLAVEVRNFKNAILDAIYVYAAEVIGVPIVYDDFVYPYWFSDLNGDGVTDPEEAISENRYNTWTPRLLRAAYNYTWAVKDPGAYAHNGLYLLQILYDTLQDIGGDVSGMTRPEVSQ